MAATPVVGDQPGFAVLAQRTSDRAVVVEESSHWGGGWAVWAFVWFIIIVAIVFFLIVAFGGEWFCDENSKDESDRKRKKDGRFGCGWGQALICAVVVALVILIIFWMLASLGGSRCATKC